MIKYKIEKKRKEIGKKKYQSIPMSICLNIKGHIAKRHFILSQILNRFSGNKAVHEIAVLKDEIKDLERDFKYYNCGDIEYTRPLPPKKNIGGKCFFCKNVKVKPKRKKKNKLL